MPKLRSNGSPAKDYRLRQGSIRSLFYPRVTADGGPLIGGCVSNINKFRTAS